MVLSKRAWAEKYKMKKIGTSLGGAFAIVGLFLVGFFTFGLAWILAGVIGIHSTAKRREKYYNKHEHEWDEEYNRYYNFETKREELKAQGIPTCPHCASDKIEVYTDIKNSFYGRYEYGVPKMICKMCGNTFKPGT